ncbi:MAG: GAF domain-containing protein [Betaproteobacteria bacterium]|nr:MAG: GAF domain-containing protein [Betaproteobacteria bacterium]
MKIRLDSIRNCLEGGIPGNIATVSTDGTPNIAYLSQVQYVDHEHVALSYQFFNTTRRNILAWPYAKVSLIDPVTAAHYRLSLQYLRTESQGPVFEIMKAKLAGIASHTGMSGIFRLLGSDIYRVLDIERVPGRALEVPPIHRNLLASLRLCAEELRAHTDLDALLTATLVALERHFDIHHAMILMLDAAAGKLYTVASRGYSASGAGAEIPVGHGVIGVAAREGTPIRIGHFSAEYAYGRAVRESMARNGQAGLIETEIPLPGLTEARSQFAVPIRGAQRTLGILYMESAQDQRFGYDDEDALVALAGLLGMAIQLLQQGEAEEAAPAVSAPARAPGPAVLVRHYAENDSVFLGEDYLIKGVAGSIFWALVRDFVEHGRVGFSNRELRLDRRIRLPDLSDNLEARLILLARRLDERGACVRILKTGRGRFELRVERPLKLVEVD